MYQMASGNIQQHRQNQPKAPNYTASTFLRILKYLPKGGTPHREIKNDYLPTNQKDNGKLMERVYGNKKKTGHKLHILHKGPYDPGQHVESCLELHSMYQQPFIRFKTSLI